jgi:hypothetical protein
MLQTSCESCEVLPADAQDFEEAALQACDLVPAGDPRIGKVPGETTSIKIGDQEGNQILEAGEGTQETSESS